MTSASRKKKSLGQHFLADKNILKRIVTAAGLSVDDVVLEIGPGAGTLTAELTTRAKRVIAIEKDAALIPFLKEKFWRTGNLEIVHADILVFDPTRYALRPQRYKIVANIPYYLTGRILRLIFTAWPRPELAVLMLQKEVAERLVAKPPKMNRLAAIVQYFASPEIVAIVRKGAFSPPPKVDSAIVKLRDIRPPTPADPLVEEVIAAGFAHPRKLLTTNLARRFGRDAVRSAFIELALPTSMRPAELEIAAWERLAAQILRSKT